MVALNISFGNVVALDVSFGNGFKKEEARQAESILGAEGVKKFVGVIMADAAAGKGVKDQSERVQEVVTFSDEYVTEDLEEVTPEMKRKFDPQEYSFPP